MKREDITVIFGAVQVSPVEMAESVLSLCLDELGGSLGSYFVPLEFDSASDSYEPKEELLDLNGREDLMNRVRGLSNCLWRCHINLGIASGYVYPAVFLEPSGTQATTLLLLIEGKITRFIEENEETRIPLFVSLCRFAAAVGADSFFSGLYIDEWKPLDKAQVFERGELGPMPFCLAWKPATINEKKLQAQLEIPADGIVETLTGYRLVDLIV